MARNRTATPVLQQRGSFEAHPERERERENEPQPKAGLGNPPKTLSPGQIQCWKELVDMAPPGVLMDSDAWTVEIASRVMCKLREGGDLPSAQWGVLISALAKMGLSPADRSKVIVAKPPKDDDSRFFGEEGKQQEKVQ